MTTTQEHFRFLDDDGNEAAASFLDALDTGVSCELDTPFRLRTVVSVSATAPGSSDYRLEYKKTTDSVWKAVGGVGGSEKICLADSTYIANGGVATTNRLSGTGSFVAGVLRDDANGEDALNVAAGEYTELEWCVEALAANGAQVSDVYQFRITRKPAGALVAQVDLPGHLGYSSSAIGTVDIPAHMGYVEQ